MPARQTNPPPDKQRVKDNGKTRVKYISAECFISSLRARPFNNNNNNGHLLLSSLFQRLSSGFSATCPTHPPTTLFIASRPPSDRFNYCRYGPATHTFKCVFSCPILGPSHSPFVPQQLRPKWKSNTPRYSARVERTRYIEEENFSFFIKI